MPVGWSCADDVIEDDRRLRVVVRAAAAGVRDGDADSGRGGGRGIVVVAVAVPAWLVNEAGVAYAP